MQMKHFLAGAFASLSFLTLSSQALADSEITSCNGTFVESDRDASKNLGTTVKSFTMLATERLDVTTSGTFTGEGNVSVDLNVNEGRVIKVCQGAQSCNGASFTAQSDINITVTISGKPDTGVATVRVACTPASTGNDDDADQKGDGLGLNETRDVLQDVLNQVSRLMSPNAATLAGLALGDGFNFNQGMTQLVSNDQDQGMKLLGALGQDHIAIGFEQKLNASAGQSLSGGSGNAVLGNVRYYNLSGEIDGNAWQGQIGYRHNLAADRTLTVYGTYRDSDVDADNFGVAIEEESYGAGAIYQGITANGLTYSVMLQYETGDADILANAATGETDVNRFTGAIGLRREHLYKSFIVKPRIVAGIVSLERETYTDSAATVIDGETSDDFFAEAGLRIAPQDVAEGALNWFFDGSVDYADETLDGSRNLSGNKISESHWAGNLEAGLRFMLDNGSELALSAGGRGLGRESRAAFGNARLTVPLQ